MRRIAAVGISIILVASACGSDDNSADTDTSSDIEAQRSEAPSQDPASPGTRGTDATSTTTPSTPTTATTEPPDSLDEAMLTQAVEEYVAAFGNGDPDAAVSLLSERCTDTISMAEYRAAVAAAEELYPGLVVDEVHDIVLEDDRAVVYYSTDPEVETEDGERWVIESGAWVWDDS
jgi:hypothetical protein